MISKLEIDQINKILNTSDNFEEKLACVFSVKTLAEAKKISKSLELEDQTVVQEILSSHILELRFYFSPNEEKEGTFSDIDIKRFLSRIHLLLSEVPTTVVYSLIALQAESSLQISKNMRKTLDKTIIKIAPTKETFTQIVGLFTSDFDPKVSSEIAMSLHTTPLLPNSPRFHLLEAISEQLDIQYLKAKKQWETITLTDLSKHGSENTPLFDALIIEADAKTAVLKTIRKSVDRIDSVKLGELLNTPSNVIELLDDEIYIKALKRLLKKNSNFENLQTHIAAPIIEIAEAKILSEREEITVEQNNSEIALAEERAKLNEEISRLEIDLLLARETLATQSTEIKTSSNAEQRQIKIDQLKAFAEIFRNMQNNHESKEREILENLFAKIFNQLDLVIIDSVSEVVDFNAVFHDCISKETSDKVKVINSTIALQEGDNNYVLLKGIVKNHE